MVWIETRKRLTEIERDIKDQLVKCDITLTVDELHIMAQLYKQDKQKASALARSIGRQETSFTPTLDKLEKAGLIIRLVHPTDRRAVLIALTDNGLALKDTILSLLTDVQKRYGSK